MVSFDNYGVLNQLFVYFFKIQLFVYIFDKKWNHIKFKWCHLIILESLNQLFVYFLKFSCLFTLLIFKWNHLKFKWCHLIIMESLNQLFVYIFENQLFVYIIDIFDCCGHLVALTTHNLRNTP